MNNINLKEDKYIYVGIDYLYSSIDSAEYFLPSVNFLELDFNHAADIIGEIKDNYSSRNKIKIYISGFFTPLQRVVFTQVLRRRGINFELQPLNKLFGGEEYIFQNGLFLEYIKNKNGQILSYSNNLNDIKKYYSHIIQDLPERFTLKDKREVNVFNFVSNLYAHEATELNIGERLKLKLKKYLDLEKRKEINKSIIKPFLSGDNFNDKVLVYTFNEPEYYENKYFCKITGFPVYFEDIKKLGAIGT